MLVFNIFRFPSHLLSSSATRNFEHIILLFQGIRVLVLNVIMGAIALQMMKFSLDVTVHRTTKATIVMKVRM